MRIALIIGVVLVVVVVVLYLMGRLRTTWLGYSPVSWGVLLLLLLLLLTAGWHLSEVEEAPKRHYEPARIENGQIVPERLY
ncbi:MAG: hypothetical protein HQL58_09675 [Magnetococcales bacterium]|nr:hypothetical protein [Magnetococcales bacterium]